MRPLATFTTAAALVIAAPSFAQTPAESPERAAEMPAPEVPVKTDGGEGGAPEETTVSDAQRPGTEPGEASAAPSGIETQTPPPRPRTAAN